MPDLDFPDLVNPAADATTPPAFDTLRARAEAHQKRRASLTALAVVVAVVAAASGIAVGTAHHDTSLPPATPTPVPTISPAPPPGRTAISDNAPDWKDMTTAEQLTWILSAGQSNQFSVDAQGDLLTIWWRDEIHGRNVHGPTHEAWQVLTSPLRSPVTRSGLISGEQVVQTNAIDGGFLVNVWPDGPVLVSLDGEVTPYQRVAAPANHVGVLHDDDVELSSSAGPALADPETRTWWPIPDAQNDVAALAPGDGSYWMWADAGRQGKSGVLIQRPHGDQPTGNVTISSNATMPGGMVGALLDGGPRLAVVAARDAATVARIQSWPVSQDGMSFQVYPADTVPFTDVASMAATPDGTLFVADDMGHLWRTTDDTWIHFTTVDGGPFSHPGLGRVLGLEAGNLGVVVETAQSGPDPSNPNAPQPPGLITLDDSGDIVPWNNHCRQTPKPANCS